MVRGPAPRHGGRVQVTGDYAVETVVARSGHVAMFWMDLDGNPIPASEVRAPRVTMTVGGRVHTAPTRVVNGGMVARFRTAPRADVVVGVPSVVVRGHAVPPVIVAEPVVVAALPPVVVVGAVAPAVVVAPAPAVVVVPPAPYIVVGGHVPNGRAHGYWRNRGYGGHGHGGRGRWR